MHYLHIVGDRLMSYIVHERNVGTALERAVDLILAIGVRDTERRNGPVLESPIPVETVYDRPRERVLFQEWRDANPFFHFYESLWMLAGRRDIAPLTRYVKRMTTFSDDGQTQNAAYGHRWRHAPYVDAYGRGETERDQLLEIFRVLRADPKSRQAVLQIWDHERDLGTATKDHACNLTVTFQIDYEKRLNMVVFCRSNDIIWGCYGANAVHFSMLHEYVWLRLRDICDIGTYTQYSVNWHAYESVFEPMQDKRNRSGLYLDPYEHMTIRAGGETVAPYDLADGVLDDTWDEDVRRFVTSDGRLPKLDSGFKNDFFIDVAWPIVAAHDHYADVVRPGRLGRAYGDRKWDGDWGPIYAHLRNCAASDWRLACEQWIDRRRLASQDAQQEK